MVETIPPQQRRVLLLLAAGCSTKQIASRLGISERTVSWHLSQLFRTFGAPNRAALVYAATLEGLLRKTPVGRP